MCVCIHRSVTLPEGIIINGSDCDAPSSAFNYRHLGNPASSFGASCQPVRRTIQGWKTIHALKHVETTKQLCQSMIPARHGSRNTKIGVWKTPSSLVNVYPSIDVHRLRLELLEEIVLLKTMGFKDTDPFGGFGLSMVWSKRKLQLREKTHKVGFPGSPKHRCPLNVHSSVSRSRWQL